MKMTKALLDSNLIIYSLVSNSSQHKKTVNFLSGLGKQKELRLYVTQQNILETHKILHSFYKQPRISSYQKILNFINALSIKIIFPKSNTLKYYSEMLGSKAHKFDHFDHFLAATMLSNKMKNIYTANDKDFKNIKKIKAINPLK